MAHESESDYVAFVEEYLEGEFGAEAVENDVILDSLRRPDFRVDMGLCKLYIEVENDAESVIAGGGQAVQYAGEGRLCHRENAIPVVITPHEETPELDSLRVAGVLVHHLPHPSPSPSEESDSEAA